MQTADALALSGSHFHACSAPSPQSNPVRLRFASKCVARNRARCRGRGHSRRPVDGSGRTVMTAAPGKLEIHVASVAFRGSARGLRNRYRVGATTTAQEQATESATRTNQRLDDIPTRVEVLDREDIEERMLMTPGRHRDAAERTAAVCASRPRRPRSVARASAFRNERPVRSLPGRWAAAVRPGGGAAWGLSRSRRWIWGTAASSTAASSSVSKWWKACARAPALLRRARRRWSFLLLRKELLRIEVGRESDIEETDHHLFPALVAPRDGLGGVGVVRVVQ